ncbi:ACP S-malonyltransferase [Metaclostridioides mangenotii]|uniref:ACP S-malonyltransferase n=1 Tax=Metaclostridioides mangenotii TaxID=1540 RepID=UPI0004656CFD|nr:ACP S-malonyltransferase [Clostridioides mangenotii]
MAKIALVFPGQGAQYTGMAKDLYEGNTIAKVIVDKACKNLNMDIKNMMFEGPDEELSKTENTQPAILIHSIAAYEALKSEIDLEFDVCLGLSLGEYSALVTAGVLDFSDAVKLVKKRGKYMQETVPLGEGTMAAILGMDRETLKKIIDKIEGGIVEVANYNSPGQIVISGETEKVREAMEKCKDSGAKRAVELSVSGPFHSSMLKEAGEKLSLELNKVNIKDSSIKVVSNVNADYYSGKYKDLLVKQVSSSVLWEDSISKLIDEGYDTFIEIGPGKTLNAFIKKISSQKDAKVEIHNIDGIDSFDKFVSKYRNGEI